MRLVIQRVSEASVTVESGERRSIGRGLAVLFGAGEGDTLDKTLLLAEKTANLRIFSDDEGKMNLSARDLGLELLVVPNFTLYSDTKKGRRPSFVKAGDPAFALAAFKKYVGELQDLNMPVKTGEFGDDMAFSLTNDGPVTIIMDTKEWENDG